MATQSAEVREIAQRKLEELERLPWDELDAYAEREEEILTPSGRVRVVSYTFWDMEPWRSDMYIKVKAYASRGWRRYWPRRAHGGRLLEDPAFPFPPGRDREGNDQL